MRIDGSLDARLRGLWENMPTQAIDLTRDRPERGRWLAPPLVAAIASRKDIDFDVRVAAIRAGVAALRRG